MSKPLDMTGNKYGKLLVVSFSHVNEHKHRCFHVKCDCGVEKIVPGHVLRNGATKSCGCLRGEFHGMSGTRTYTAWCDAKSRCYNTNDIGYKYYGGRGIKICERWWKFSDFLKDMGECPDGLSLERVNNNGNYEPGNCKWATQKEQCNNNRRNVKLTYKGKTMNMVQWAEELGISRACIWARINRRMPDEMIFTSRKFKPYEARDMN